MTTACSTTVEAYFTSLARKVERIVGSPWSFIIAFVSVVVWAATGPLFHFSDTWQIVINTATTIVTFLIVFLIQATQTRDTLAIHVKLDELLRAIGEARTPIALAEEMPRDELERLHDEITDIAKGELNQP